MIPGWVTDLEAFRRWAYSPEYPEQGWLSYLAGVVWSDPGPEEIFSHNQVRGAFLPVLVGLEDELGGWYVPGYPLWTNRKADIATEADGLFATAETLRSGRLRVLPDPRGGHSELDGSPDMVLEVVSDASAERDCEQFLTLYWRADVSEYWLVDARGPEPRFLIYRHTPSGYKAVLDSEGWVDSPLFGRAFRLTQSLDPVGHPEYTLEVRLPRIMP